MIDRIDIDACGKAFQRRAVAAAEGFSTGEAGDFVFSLEEEVSASELASSLSWLVVLRRGVFGWAGSLEGTRSSAAAACVVF